jgi:N-methylhydantoinase B
MPPDAITIEVLRNRLDAIAQEMQTTLLRSAYSIMLKEGGDCSCAILSAEGETIAQAVSNPIHIAAFLPACRHVLRRFPADTIREGDVFVLNDPYDGGTHVPDVIAMVPIFVDGRLVAIGCSLGHHQDMGGMAPGSMPASATEVYQEGFLIPPSRLYAAGALNDTLVELMLRNVRVPDLVYGDLMAQVAAGRTAAARLADLAGRYGLAVIEEAIAALLDQEERLVRAELGAMRPGVYDFEDYLDNDGIDLDRSVPIKVRVTLGGGDLHVDFTGTSAQVRGPANCPEGAVLAAVYYVVQALTRAGLPSNSGAFRPVSVHVPKGSLLDPLPPAPVGIRYHTLKRVVDALMGALAPALDGRIPAAPHGSDMCMSWGGVRPENARAFVYMECTTGGTGATARHDGVDHMACDIGNSRNIPAEAAELEYPVRIWANRMRRDSGGPGRFRGGLGVERTVELLADHATVSHRSDRHLTPPWGLHGGLPGARWITMVQRADGTRTVMPGRMVFGLAKGDRVIGYTGGGGGYGDPTLRPVEAVAADVADRKVSIEHAARFYKVALSREGTVDEAATRRLRAAEAAAPAASADPVNRGERGLGLEVTP